MELPERVNLFGGLMFLRFLVHGKAISFVNASQRAEHRQERVAGQRHSRLAIGS